MPQSLILPSLIRVVLNPLVPHPMRFNPVLPHPVLFHRDLPRDSLRLGVTVRCAQ